MCLNKKPQRSFEKIREKKTQRFIRQTRIEPSNSVLSSQGMLSHQSQHRLASLDYLIVLFKEGYTQEIKHGYLKNDGLETVSPFKYG